MKKLPTGESSFEKIRTGGYLYVDKTEQLYELLNGRGGDFYFLSRPRRFGKSLTVTTIKTLFEGRKELFEGLWIYDKWDWSQQFPVLMFSFAEVDFKAQDLETGLRNAMDNLARLHDISLRNGTAKEKFLQLILELGARNKVVVLIDEYDKPLVDFLHDPARSDENRDIVRNFLGVLKDLHVADRLKFVFVTGVSKFSRVTLFSELNNLTDLTLSRRHASLLGITQEELEHYFAEHIETTAQEMALTKQDLLAQIKYWYNGYSWDGQHFVYNPFSVLHFFNAREFSNYWFQSGTTAWLVKNFRARQADIARFEGMVVGASFFDKFEISALEPSTLLFQTGYLTVKEVETSGFEKWYHLDYPNHEVRYSLFQHLFQEYAEKQTGELGETMRKLESTLVQNDLTAFVGLFKGIFADISNRMLKQYIEQDSLQLWEAYYQTVIYLALNLTGSKVACEVQTNHGYIDAVAETEKYVYVMEFKVGKAEKALAQIKEKHYFEKYLNKGKQVFLLAVGFDTEKRNISDWIVEEMN